MDGYLAHAAADVIPLRAGLGVLLGARPVVHRRAVLGARVGAGLVVRVGAGTGVRVGAEPGKTQSSTWVGAGLGVHVGAGRGVHVGADTGSFHTSSVLTLRLWSLYEVWYPTAFHRELDGVLQCGRQQ